MGTPKTHLISNKAMYVLNEEFYPECWQDDARMGVFLSEFRVRSLNPDNYDSKMKFWKEMIACYCEHKGSSNVSITELKSVFKRKGTSPYCLDVVFEDMLKFGEIQLKQTYMEPPQDTWSGWAVNSLVKKPFSWGFNKIKEKFVPTRDESFEFIVLDVVKKQTLQLEKHLQNINRNNSVISLETVMNNINDTGLTREGVQLVIQNMYCKHQVYIERNSENPDDEKQVLLKFAGSNLKAMPITDIERSIHNMENTEKTLMKVIEKLEAEIITVMLLVKGCIHEGKRQTAKTYLKKKHVLEKSLDKKLSVLENVQAMLARIHDSQSDKNVIEAYKIGSNALKTAFASSGITLDTVDDTIAEMKEILEQQDEMQSMIGTPAANEIDELELEQELSDLLDDELIQSGKIAKPPTDLEIIDDEIEKRLAKLKTDFSSPSSEASSTITVPTTATTTTGSAPPTSTIIVP